jgi:probable rRNA maturation factor
VSTGKILFFTEGIGFQLRDKRKIRDWINSCVRNEKKVLRSINFIYCSDAYLLKLNIQYLGHKTLTDILTFGNSDQPDEISGDIFISIERVRENSIRFKTGFKSELHRVMIHGILHLCGHRDTLKSEKSAIRQKEDYCLSLLPGFL